VAKNVVKAMEQLRYHPSARRRGRKPYSRRGIRTGNILLLGLGYEAGELYRMPVFPSLLHGVEIAVREAGMYLILGGYHNGESLPAALGGNQIDGALLMGRSEVLTSVIRARLEGIVVVGLMRGFEDHKPAVDRVLYDNSAVGPLAAKYLLGRGHQSVAFVNAHPDHPAFAARRAGFVAAVKEAGATILELISPSAPQDITEELAQYQSLATRLAQSGIRAVFVPNDAQIPMLYRALETVGKSPGEDLDIISCANEQQFLSRLNPRPATIDINLELVGRRGVQQLLWRLAHPNESSRITVLVEPLLVPAQK
jgi:LacI family transcriptional regulator